MLVGTRCPKVHLVPGCRLTWAILGLPSGVVVEDVQWFGWSGGRRDKGLDGREGGAAGRKRNMIGRGKEWVKGHVRMGQRSSLTVNGNITGITVSALQLKD